MELTAFGAMDYRKMSFSHAVQIQDIPFFLKTGLQTMVTRVERLLIEACYFVSARASANWHATWVKTLGRNNITVVSDQARQKWIGNDIVQFVVS